MSHKIKTVKTGFSKCAHHYWACVLLPVQTPYCIYHYVGIGRNQRLQWELVTSAWYPGVSPHHPLSSNIQSKNQSKAPRTAL